MTKTICTAFGIVVAFVGFVVSIGVYGNNRYCQGYTNGLLDGAEAGINMVDN